MFYTILIWPRQVEEEEEDLAHQTEFLPPVKGLGVGEGGAGLRDQVDLVLAGSQTRSLTILCRVDLPRKDKVIRLSKAFKIR